MATKDNFNILLVACQDALEWLISGKVDGVGFDEQQVIDSLQTAIKKVTGDETQPEDDNMVALKMGRVTLSLSYKVNLLNDRMVEHAKDALLEDIRNLDRNSELDRCFDLEPDPGLRIGDIDEFLWEDAFLSELTATTEKAIAVLEGLANSDENVKRIKGVLVETREEGISDESLEKLLDNAKDCLGIFDSLSVTGPIPDHLRTLSAG